MAVNTVQKNKTQKRNAKERREAAALDKASREELVGKLAEQGTEAVRMDVWERSFQGRAGAKPELGPWLHELRSKSQWEFTRMSKG